MPKLIDQKPYASGRILKEDDSVVNIAEGFDSSAKAFNMKLTGSSAQVADAKIKEILTKPYKNILNIVGKEKVKFMLPFWETTGPYKCIVNPNLSFSAEAGLSTVASDYGYALNFTAANQRLKQNFLAEVDTSAVEGKMDSTTAKLAVKIPANIATTKLGFCSLKLKRTGTLASAKLRIRFYKDSSGSPGAEATQLQFDRRDITVAASYVATSFGWVGLPFLNEYEIVKSYPYWIVLEYADATGVDESNYISWAYKTTAGAWGDGADARAVYNGTNWTVTANQPHAIRLYSPQASFPNGDWTFIFCGYESEANPPGARTVIGHRAKDSTAYAFQIGQYSGDSFYVVYNNYRHGMADKAYQILTNGITVTTSDVYAVTYSKSRSPEKVKIYKGGQLRDVLRGDGNGMLPKMPNPLSIGATTILGEGLIRQWYGKLGPVMLFAKELSADEIRLVTNELESIKRSNIMGVN